MKEKYQNEWNNLFGIGAYWQRKIEAIDFKDYQFNHYTTQTQQ